MPGVFLGPPQTVPVAAYPHYRPPSTPGPFQGLPGIPATTVGGHTGYLLTQQRLDDSSRKCVVIDLDETLVHSSFKVRSLTAASLRSRKTALHVLSAALLTREFKVEAS